MIRLQLGDEIRPPDIASSLAHRHWNSTSYRAAAGLIVLLTLWACGGSVAGPDAAWHFEGMQPYATYKSAETLRLVWNQAERCSGLRGDFDAVTFYTATSITRGGKRYGGAWLSDGNRIVLAQGIFGAENEAHLIMHEEMHALLKTRSHPEMYFNGLCGNLMAYIAN